MCFELPFRSFLAILEKMRDGFERPRGN